MITIIRDYDLIDRFNHWKTSHVADVRLPNGKRETVPWDVVKWLQKHYPEFIIDKRGKRLTAPEWQDSNLHQSQVRDTPTDTSGIASADS